MTEPRIIVHGGAWTIPADRRKAHVDGCRAAVDAVWGELQRGMPALEAVRLAVNVLEADPTYDAGRGAVLNADGQIELDAAIMDGATLNFGAVAAVRGFLHPVDIARKVMDTEFCFLVGEGAERFAREAGIEAIDPTELVVEREVRLFNELRARAGFSTHDAFRPQGAAETGDAACRCPEPPMPKGTVGAVALDAAGNVAAATSTGGHLRGQRDRRGLGHRLRRRDHPGAADPLRLRLPVRRGQRRAVLPRRCRPQGHRTAAPPGVRPRRADHAGPARPLRRALQHRAHGPCLRPAGRGHSCGCARAALTAPDLRDPTCGANRAAPAGRGRRRVLTAPDMDSPRECA